MRGARRAEVSSARPPAPGAGEGSAYDGFEYYNDENHWWSFCRFVDCRDSWASGVGARYFASSCVRLDGCTACTVQDCRVSKFVSNASGVPRPAWCQKTAGGLCRLCATHRHPGENLAAEGRRRRGA